MEFQKTPANLSPCHHSCSLPSSKVLVTSCLKHSVAFYKMIKNPCCGTQLSTSAIQTCPSALVPSSWANPSNSSASWTSHTSRFQLHKWYSPGQDLPVLAILQDRLMYRHKTFFVTLSNLNLISTCVIGWLIYASSLYHKLHKKRIMFRCTPYQSQTLLLMYQFW